MQTTPKLETHHFPQEATSIGGGERSCNNWALELQGENAQMRSGSPDPKDFRMKSVQLKCILPEFSNSNSTEPPLSLSKPLLPTTQQAASKQAVVIELECGVLALLTAPDAQLCLPTLPLFKNKTKSPTPPLASKTLGKDRW